MGDEIQLSPLSNGHRSDAIATKLFDKSGDLQKKVRDKSHKPEKPPPAGGLDKTPFPSAPAGFTLKFTFHRATSLPMADLNSLSSDPFLLVQLNTDLAPRHKKDPRMRLRTPTVRRSTDPVWNCEWIVANIPASGFALKARIYDEDPADHDDRLGNVHLHVNHLAEGWEGIREQSFKVKKRMGSKRAYLIRGCAAMFSSNVQMSGNLIMSVEMLGRTEENHEGRIWTVGPCAWTEHLSPMIGMLVGTKESGKGTESEKYSFQANQIQLQGPVPASLYHRYVEFKPFVAGMFNAKSPRGWILNRALHHQHARVYNYSRSTIYGSFPSPSTELTLKFLELANYDRGGRIFTYVITLDGQWRFTETGKEFGIDLLSKHTMHSDVNIYIAYSGEFFIRRLKSPHRPPLEQETHPPDEIEGAPPTDNNNNNANTNEPLPDPAYYALIIDNDSGTYRPNAGLLPDLKKFMERNLPGIKIVTLDCMGDKERMDRMKNEQRKKKKESKNRRVYRQDDGSSLSSSDEEELERRARSADGEGEGEGGVGGDERGDENQNVNQNQNQKGNGDERGDGDGKGKGNNDKNEVKK